MKSKYHIEMTRDALEGIFSDKALQTIIRANIWQDRPQNQFSRDYIHFDGSAFEAGYAYIAHQKQAILSFLNSGKIKPAQKAFGQIIHTWQDFYSHSNYVQLWLKQHPETIPDEIEPADPSSLNSPELFSGVNYGLIEFIAMLPLLSKWVYERMPDDSHAKNNMDDPLANPLFPYAIAAATKRTRLVWRELQVKFKEYHLPQPLIDQFLGRENNN
ncbi:hypothetical protein JR338_03225 [Chloroflexota bacterium]|nr:hypothetical protein JR338_03225 [Chloroflexota bacterium]